MQRFFSACAIVAAFAVSISAQDTTIKSKTKVDADDAKVMTLTGCLQSGTGQIFTLTSAKAAAGGELETKEKTKIDVDKDETEVKTKRRTEIEDTETPRGTAGMVTTYDLMAQEGVNLMPHVGHRVEITGVAVNKKDGDDDAEVEIETKTKVEREDAPDARMKSRTEAELPRGAHKRLTVMSVKHISPSCTM